jgi:hypothetical protein
MSRLPHFLHNWLTDGGEVVSLTCQPAALYPQEDFWYSFLLEDHSAPGRIRSIENLITMGIEPTTFQLVA